MARLSTSGVSDYYHRRIVVEDEPYRLDTTHERPDDEVYYDRMHRVLSAYPTVGIPREPTNLIGRSWCEGYYIPLAYWGGGGKGALPPPPKIG